jgi:hypothetical protein
VATALAEGAALAIVPLVRDVGRPAKANLSLDAGLLAAIDEAAAARGWSKIALSADLSPRCVQRRRAINRTPNPGLTVSERRTQSFRSARAERALLASPAATAGAVLPQLLRI